jgi:hypothetical protein
MSSLVRRNVHFNICTVVKLLKVKNISVLRFFECRWLNNLRKHSKQMNQNKTNLMQQILVYSINFISTCFGYIYAHRQKSRLRFTAYGFQHWLLLVVVLESRE